jgi:tetratricopeptide (TPR) repeat protein
MGYWAVGWDDWGLGERVSGSEYYAKAYQLREHTSERERLTIIADYYQGVTGEVDKAVQTFQEQIENYPREVAAYSHLGNLYALQGQYEKAAETISQAVRIAPNDVTGYVDLANCPLDLHRFNEARQIIRDAQARKLDDAFGPRLTAIALASSLGMPSTQRSRVAADAFACIDTSVRTSPLKNGWRRR